MNPNSCLRQGFQPCLDIHGVCTQFYQNCSTPCKSNSDCLSNCCLYLWCNSKEGTCPNGELDNAAQSLAVTISCLSFLLFIFMLFYCCLRSRQAEREVLVQRRNQQASGLVHPLPNQSHLSHPPQIVRINEFVPQIHEILVIPLTSSGKIAGDNPFQPIIVDEQYNQRLFLFPMVGIPLPEEKSVDI